MLKFYFHPSPNPLKVALLLEELGAPYELVAVDTFKGEQHAPDFLRINPNAKVPAIVDGETKGCSTRTPSSSTSPRSTGASCRRSAPGAARS